MPICGIYKITNQINGKCYIGQSVNIAKDGQSIVAKLLQKVQKDLKVIFIVLSENTDQKIFLLRFQKNVLEKN